MDDKLDLSGLSSLASSDSGIGDAVSKLLSRPDLIMNIANELGLGRGDSNAPEEEGKATGDRKELKDGKSIVEESGDSILTAGKDNGAYSQGKPRKGENYSDKKKLLLALRPYMSERRREAVDMMINLESIGDLVGKLDPGLILRMLGGEKNV